MPIVSDNEYFVYWLFPGSHFGVRPVIVCPIYKIKIIVLQLSRDSITLNELYWIAMPDFNNCIIDNYMNRFPVEKVLLFPSKIK